MPKLQQRDPRVSYMGEEQGPFQCGHCVFFLEPSGCDKVAGVIERYGCCNLYEKANNNPGGHVPRRERPRATVNFGAVINVADSSERDLTQSEWTRVFDVLNTHLRRAAIQLERRGIDIEFSLDED